MSIAEETKWFVRWDVDSASWAVVLDYKKNGVGFKETGHYSKYHAEERRDELNKIGEEL